MKGGGGKKRSEIDRERTKMRERIRRAISSKIFTGIRKHGGYGFSDRCDTNVVLRRLANEAGFVVEPDGTTYRPKDLIKCPLCGATNADLSSIPNDTTITANGSSLMTSGVGNSSMTSFPTLGGVNINSIGDPACIVAMNNNDNDANNLGYFSPLPGFDGPTTVPMYACQDHVALESGGVDGGYGFGEYCVTMAMGNDGNGSGMTYQKIQNQEVLHLEEGGNMCNSNHIYNTMVESMPISQPHFNLKNQQNNK